MVKSVFKVMDLEAAVVDGFYINSKFKLRESVTLKMNQIRNADALVFATSILT